MTGPAARRAGPPFVQPRRGMQPHFSTAAALAGHAQCDLESAWAALDMPATQDRKVPNEPFTGHWPGAKR
jgi:hypothetical protein